MFGVQKKTLIVVYKDELLVNQLRKMVEAKDDIEGGNTIGTRDDSINIVAWDEKVWLGNKKAGNIKDKVLFLGEIKGTDKLVPVIDVKFDEYGVKFGWAGNQAAVFTDVKELNDREKYLSFIKKLSELAVPEMIKKPQNVRIDVSDIQEQTEETVEISPTTENGKKKSKILFDKAKEQLAKGAEIVGKVSVKVAAKTEDYLRANNAVTQQMLFYGVVNLYTKGLEEFMNS